MKKVLVAITALMVIFALTSCEEKVDWFKVNFHGSPLEEVYIPPNKHYHSNICDFDKTRIIEGATFMHKNEGGVELKYYDKTNNTVSYLVERKNLGYCYEVYNADKDGKPIIESNYSTPIMAYLIKTDNYYYYKWAAKDSDKGKVVVGKANQICGSINILKDSTLPEEDEALNGWFCGYFDGENSRKGSNGDKFKSFANVFVWLGSNDFMDIQQEQGTDIFNENLEGYVERVSKLAAIPWEKTYEASYIEVKGIAIGLDGNNQPIFDE